MGQTYFAVKTRQQEIVENIEQLSEDEKRLGTENLKNWFYVAQKLGVLLMRKNFYLYAHSIMYSSFSEM